MKAVILALLGLVTSAATARADYSAEWRDGCPAGNLSKKHDIQADESPDPPPVYEGSDPQRVGALAQGDSALAGDRFGIDSTYARYRSVSTIATPTSVVEQTARVQATWSFVSRSTVLVGLGGTVQFSWLRLSDAGDAMARFGSVVIEPVARIQWLASGTNALPLGPDRRGLHDAPAGIRNGVALQPILSIPVDTSMGAIAENTQIWRRTAFDGYLSSPRATYGGAFEERTEGVGCYAPFIHFRLSLTATTVIDDPSRPGVAHTIFLAPETLTVGLSVSAHVAAYLQYGALVYVGLDDSPGAPAPLVGATVIHRFRLGGELAWSSWSLGAHLDFFRGSTLYDGAVLGGSLNWNWGG